MSNVERLETLIHKTSLRHGWGAYDKKGDRAVARVMMKAVNTLHDIATNEQQPGQFFSLAKRVTAIEKAVQGFRKAAASNPDSGLEDTSPRDGVFGFLKHALIESGVDENLAWEIMRTMPIDRF